VQACGADAKSVIIQGFPEYFPGRDDIPAPAAGAGGLFSACAAGGHSRYRSSTRARFSHGQHRLRPQARPPGRQAQPAQFEPALAPAHRDQSVRKAILAGDKEAATKTLQSAQSVIDKIADKKIVHKNAASRQKSRLAAAIKSMN